MTWTIALPAGYRAASDRGLFQCGANARLHRMARARITRKIRTDTKLIAMLMRVRHELPAITVPVVITAVQHPAFRARTCDTENIAPIVKAMIDGLRDAGVLPNDSPKFVTETRFTVGDRVRGSQLVLHITPAEPESAAA